MVERVENSVCVLWDQEEAGLDLSCKDASGWRKDSRVGTKEIIMQRVRETLLGQLRHQYKGAERLGP